MSTGLMVVLISAATAVLGFAAAIAWGLRADIRRAMADYRKRRATAPKGPDAEETS